VLGFPDTAWDEDVCAHHGLMAHLYVHEAALALAAVEHDIPFTAVTVTIPTTADEVLQVALTGVEVSAPFGWMRSTPLAALEFVLAGSLAEEAEWGDTLPNSLAVDVERWRQGVGLPEDYTEADVTTAIGEPLPEVINRARGRARANRDRVLVLALALADAGTMTSEEVRAL
jgi:hypothetical protein